MRFLRLSSPEIPGRLLSFTLLSCVIALPTFQSALATEIYKDWAVACDNTRHCEAIGFQNQDSVSAPVLLYLQRDAGPATLVQATFIALSEDGVHDQPLTVRINKLTLHGVKSDRPLSPDQVRRLLPMLLDAPEARLTDGKTTWILSLAGLKAALLKMDDAQGRLRTPGALVRKGSKPESTALPALSAPVWQQAPLAPARKGDEKLLIPILNTIKDRTCWGEVPDNYEPDASLTRLTGTQVLVMRECSRHAYQISYAAWVANDKPPYNPQRVILPTDSGEMVDYAMNADFEGGILSTYAKGRGLFDCGGIASWVWTVSGFILLEEAVQPLCRGFTGGGIFMLRTWKATVRH